MKRDLGEELKGINMTKKTGGRPPGQKNHERPQVVVKPTCCPRPECRSTQREVLRIAVTREIAGVTQEGHEYTHIVWRDVQCRACGQHYRLICYECRKKR